LVTIIIPCYNAEGWIGEAIQSCLNQTYQPVEIIVVNDGSTDRSLEIVQKFGSHVRWETGPNRGGNAARNRGFALSRGEFIQFLDADDLILPEKIAVQVDCLEQTNSSVVYSDWRHQHHEPNGTLKLEDIKVSGEHSDILGALLGRWWVAPVALLFRRDIVERVGGWDESLLAAQDTDFFISVALADAPVVYQPGCHSIYRRHGSESVSTSNRLRWLDSHSRVLDKAKEALSSSGRMKPGYRKGLAHSYFALARNYYDIDRRKYDNLMAKVVALQPAFRPCESLLYNITQLALGFHTAEQLASWKRRLVSR
jgi:glycosyltransferase involved in cell wall biosynthesis